MDATLFPDWNSDIGVEFPLPIQRQSLGLENELVELLWQNGEVILQSQSNNRKQSHDHSWMDCPIDESLEKELCTNNVLPEISPVLSPPGCPCPDSFGARKTVDVVKRQALNSVERGGGRECSTKTIGSSNQASNEAFAREIGPLCESMETGRGTLERVITPSCRRRGSLSNDTNKNKRKSRDVGESECPSDATELDSATGNNPSSQKSSRSRVAHVHNMSERRRRDRINEKMRALQELIPHSNKSDKASMLDEAIEYMKSLQLQLQLLWMGSGMAQMMVAAGMQPYMARMGMLPTIQNLMCLSRFPLLDPPLPIPSSIHYQNPNFTDQLCPTFMPFNNSMPIPNAPQPMNIFNYGSHSAQQNPDASTSTARH